MSVQLQERPIQVQDADSLTGHVLPAAHAIYTARLSSFAMFWLCANVALFVMLAGAMLFAALIGIDGLANHSAFLWGCGTTMGIVVLSHYAAVRFERFASGQMKSHI